MTDICADSRKLTWTGLIYRLSRQNLPQKEQNKGSKRMDE
jgi:hypothetical protein